MKKNMYSIIGAALTALLFSTFSAPALAGCDPKCSSGEHCSYEGVGGKDVYTCVPNKAVKKGSASIRDRDGEMTPKSNADRKVMK